MSHDLLSIRKEALSPEELISVTYLEDRMRGDNELAILARVIHQQIAFGRMNVRAFADQIGAFTPDGIYEDGDDDNVPLVVEPQPSLMDDDSDDIPESLDSPIDESEDDETVELPAELPSSDTEENGPTKEE